MTIFDACETNDLKFVKNYIKSGANIDAIDDGGGGGKTPLQYLNDENKKIINHFITTLKYLKNN